jgi:hypothetical protein
MPLSEEDKFEILQKLGITEDILEKFPEESELTQEEEEADILRSFSKSVSAQHKRFKVLSSLFDSDGNCFDCSQPVLKLKQFYDMDDEQVRLMWASSPFNPQNKEVTEQ